LPADQFRVGPKTELRRRSPAGNGFRSMVERIKSDARSALVAA
jgi:hypothetical protein